MALVEDGANCVMQFATAQISEFRCAIDIAARVLMEGGIMFDKDGVRMCLLTVDKILLTTMFLPAASTDSGGAKIDVYNFTAKEPITCNVNFKELHAFLKQAQQEDTLIMQLTKASLAKSTLLVHIRNSEYTLSKEMALLEMINEMVVPPVVSFALCVRMDSAKFQRIVRATSDQSQYLQFLASIKPPRLFMVGRTLSSTVMATVSFTPAPEPAPATSEQAAAAAAATTAGENEMPMDGGAPRIRARQVACDKRDQYATCALQSLTMAAGCGQSVEVFLQPDCVLVLRYPVGTLGHVLFALAPAVKPGEVTLASITSGRLKDQPMLLARPTETPNATDAAAAVATAAAGGGRRQANDAEFDRIALKRSAAKAPPVKQKRPRKRALPGDGAAPPAPRKPKAAAAAAARSPSPSPEEDNDDNDAVERDSLMDMLMGNDP